MCKFCTLCQTIFSVFYNISQPNFAILQILKWSFQLCWLYISFLLRSKFSPYSELSFVKDVLRKRFNFHSVFLQKIEWPVLLTTSVHGRADIFSWIPTTKITTPAMAIIHPTIVANRKNSMFPFFSNISKNFSGALFRKWPARENAISRIIYTDDTTIQGVL